MELNIKEAELYISMPQVDFNSLREARLLLALPASSTGVERLFSRSGETHGDKRKRLKEETLQSLMYVNKNA